MVGEGTRIAARDILNAIVEVVSDALLSGDFETFATVMHVPQTMTMIAGPIHMDTPEDMRRGFDEMHAMFRRNGVTELHTEIGECQFVSPTRITSQQVTEGRNGSGIAMHPFAIMLVIDQVDGAWMVTQSEYLVAPESEPAKALAEADRTARKL